MPVVSATGRSGWPALRRSIARFHEVAKFGTVGGVCYVIDVFIFNLFHAGVGTGPLSAKTISTIVAGTCAYLGNRHWSFTHRARTGVRREYSLFISLNAIGLGIALACLGFTKYVLGMDGTLAVNISGNIVGTGLGTIFRFWAYKRWVFLHPDHPRAVPAPGDVPPPPTSASSGHSVTRVPTSHRRRAAVPTVQATRR